MRKKKTKSYAYLLDFGKFYKVGKTNNYERRIAELEYNYDESCLDILRLYEFDSEEKALTMENVMRDKFKLKKYSRFIPKDRFKGSRPIETDLIELDKKAKEVINLFTW